MISKHIKNTHVLQQGQSDCGVACLLSIIKFYYGNDTLENLRNLSGTSIAGTTLLGLHQAANSLGFDAEGYKSSIESLKYHGEPVILLTFNEGQAQHYVVCYEYDFERGFLIGDPAKGLSYIAETELDIMWDSKKCLVLSLNEKFVTTKQEKYLQRKYFLKILNEDKKLLLFSVFLGVLVAALGLSMSIFSQKLIDDILPSNKISKLITGLILLTILQLARVGVIILREFIMLEQSKNFNNRINNKFYNSLLHLKKSFFDSRKTGELVARSNDINRIQGVIKLLVSNFAIDVLVALLSVIFLYIYSWQVATMSLIILPIYFYIIYRKNNNIINAQKEIMQTNAFYEGNYISTIQGISTIKNTNKQDVFAKINKLIFGDLQNKIFILGKININLSWQSGLVNVFFMIGILIYTSISVFNNQMKLGELMAVIGIAGTLFPSIASLAMISIPINEAKIAFNRMYEFASIEKEKEEGLSIAEINSISIQNLSFRFAGRSKLFTDINLNIKKGKLTAIVGESGSGKSTIGQILQRFYDYNEGEIYVNNQYKLSEVKLKMFREYLGVLPQEISIFNGNVIENILLDESESIDNLNEFILEYGFDYYFNQLPQGIYTNLGEEGINLSGGQKQIIALARILYRKPQFLILDEATSAMDRNTENFTLKILEKIKPECAILFISHRLNILKGIADVIYVLENKTVINFGSHNELMKSDNFYSEYWNSFKK